jgi:hypothetical protein
MESLFCGKKKPVQALLFGELKLEEILQELFALMETNFFGRYAQIILPKNLEVGYYLKDHEV